MDRTLAMCITRIKVIHITSYISQPYNLLNGHTITDMTVNITIQKGKLNYIKIKSTRL